jgi:hypothetical protein
MGRLVVLFSALASVACLYINTSRIRDLSTNSFWSAGLMSPVMRFVAVIFLPPCTKTGPYHICEPFVFPAGHMATYVGLHEESDTPEFHGAAVLFASKIILL